MDFFLIWAADTLIVLYTVLPIDDTMISNTVQQYRYKKNMKNQNHEVIGTPTIIIILSYTTT